MDKVKKDYIEFLRLIACFLVIVNHTNSQIFLSASPSPLWFASLTYFFVSKTAVPLFLMIMGALLLGKRDTPKKSAQRLLRILTVLLISSALCYLYFGWMDGTLGQLGVGDFFLTALQRELTGSFWYLYLYLGLLCLLPLMQKLASSLDRQGLEWLLILSVGFMGTLPILTAFFPSFSLHPSFTAPLVSSYVGTVFCGYYIERYVPNTRKTFAVSSGLFLALLLFQVLATYHFYLREPSSYLQLDDRSFATIICSAACLYLMVRYLFAHIHPHPGFFSTVRHLGGLTFGMYLLSDLAISALSFLYPQLCLRLPIPAAMLLWELVIFAVCALAAALLKLIPGLKKLL